MTYGATTNKIVNPNNKEIIVDSSDKKSIQIKSYTLSMNKNDELGGEIFPSTSFTRYFEPTQVTLNATPTKDVTGEYAFVQWELSSGATSSDSNFQIYVNEDIVATATFLEYKYTLDLANETTQSTWGKVGESAYTPNGKYYLGQEVTITATPETGYDFDFWKFSDDSTSENNPLVIVMNDNKIIKANYKKEKSELTMNQVGNGYVTPSIDLTHTYKTGTEVQLTAQASPGWQFYQWLGDVSSTHTANTNITMDTDKVATAVFLEEFDLTVKKIGNGTVNPEFGTYLDGEKVTITAQASSGWGFFQWLGDISATDTSISTITMNTDKMATAIFLECKYTLTLEKETNQSTLGKVGKSPDLSKYYEGQKVTITATPNEGYEFSHWKFSDNSTSSDNPYNLTINEDKIATAVFSVEFPDLVSVPAGTFMMGSNDGNDNEKPIHEVTLSYDFSIGKYEITNAEYCAFLNDAGVTVNGIKDEKELIDINDIDCHIDHNGTYFYVEKTEEINYENYPVTFVTWWGAIYYCNWLSQKEGLNFAYNPNSGELIDYPNKNGYRLPTEAEWEFSARGRTDTFKYSGSDNISEVAWYKYNSGMQIHEIGTKKQNSLEIYDMSGNLCEWCNDWFGYDYYSVSPETDPIGPSSGTHKIHRGGSYISNDKECSVSFRSNFPPETKKSYIGFRICKTKKVYNIYSFTMGETSNGTVTPLPDTYFEFENEVITLVATPDTGYAFSHWKGDVKKTNATQTTIIIDEDKIATAVFLEEFDLTVNKIGDGTVNPESGIYIDGEEVIITAQASSDWVFFKWMGDVSATDTAISTITMNSDKTATALFVESVNLNINFIYWDGSKYDLVRGIIECWEDGSSSEKIIINKSGIYSGSFKKGVEYYIKGIPNSGCEFMGWAITDDPNNLTSTNPINLIFDSDITIYAWFTK